MVQESSQPRRSQREKRKPKDIYVVEEPDDVKNAESSVESDSASDVENVALNNRNSQSNRVKRRGRPRPKKLRVVKEADHENSDSEEEDNSEGTLFEAVRTPNSALAAVVSEWSTRFQDNKNAASAEIVNFILQSCGGNAIYVQENEDLGSLDMNELVEHVVEDLEISGEEYPIVARGKTLKKFGSNFAEFWKSIVDVCYRAENKDYVTLVQRCIEWLTSLSSASAQAVRHTATIASLVIGNTLVEICAEFLDKIALSERQMAAEKKKSKENPKKLNLLRSNIEYYGERKTELEEFLMAIFNGVIVHRYRDVMPTLRGETIDTLAKWMSELPSVFFQDNYLKYIGWMLNDTNSQVRLSVVQALLEIYKLDDIAEKIEMFNSRFLPRYVTLCRDVDVEVAIHAIKLLMRIDELDLLDIEEEDIRSVEMLVFDEHEPRLRKMASEFIVMQYEVFGPLKGNSKPTVAVIEEHLTTQMSALVELASGNVGDNYHLTEYLVDAFWDNKSCDALRSWSVQTNLLVTDDKSRQLNSAEQNILINIMLFALQRLSSQGPTKTDHGFEEFRSSTTVHFINNLPILITRFRDNQEKLSALLKIPQYLSLDGSVLSSVSNKFSDLLTRIKDAYSTQVSEKSTQDTAQTIAYLVNLNYSKKEEAETMLTELLEDIMTTTSRLLQKASPGARNKKLKDDEYSLSLNLRRLQCLIATIDVNDYVSSEDMNELCDKIFSLLEERANITEVSKSPFMFESASSLESCMFLYWRLIWKVRKLFDMAESAKKAANPISGSLAEVCSDMVIFRDRFADVLRLYLECRYDDNDEELRLNVASDKYVSAMEYVAYKCFCDMCCIIQIPELQKTILGKEIYWSPKKELVLAIQSYFERVMDTPADQVDTDTDNLANIPHKSCILAALARKTRWAAHTKGQSAALMRYMNSTDSIIADISRTMSKDTFEECLAIQDDEEADPNAFMEALSELKGLGRKLSQTLGVGKVPVSLRSALLKFLKEGLRYSMEDISKYTFLEVLRPYVGHLDKQGLNELKRSFLDVEAELPQNAKLEMAEEESKDKGARLLHWASVIDFKDLVRSEKSREKTPSPPVARQTNVNLEVSMTEVSSPSTRYLKRSFDDESIASDESHDETVSSPTKSRRRVM